LIAYHVSCSVLGCVFFSGRSRHTSSKRDWSSAVCSSDLSSTILARSAWRISSAPCSDPARPAQPARCGPPHPPCPLRPATAHSPPHPAQDELLVIGMTSTSLRGCGHAGDKKFVVQHPLPRAPAPGTGVGSDCEPWRSCSGAFEETDDLAPPEGSDLVDGFQDRALGVLPADPDLFIAEAEDLQAVADGAQVTAPVAEEGILLLMMRTPVDLEEEAADVHVDEPHAREMDLLLHVEAATAQPSHHPGLGAGIARGGQRADP